MRTTRQREDRIQTAVRLVTYKVYCHTQVGAEGPGTQSREGHNTSYGTPGIVCSEEAELFLTQKTHWRTVRACVFSLVRALFGCFRCGPVLAERHSDLYKTVQGFLCCL